MLQALMIGWAMVRAGAFTPRAVPPDPPPVLYPYWAHVGKAWDPKRWPNFMPGELSCNCGGRFCVSEYYHDADFLDRLQTMRTAVGKPFRINSGHRCKRWNAAVGGAPRSRHKDIAADISLTGHDPAQLYAEARRAGFSGIGFGGSFLHVDVRSAVTHWGYGKGSIQTWTHAGVKFSEDGKQVIAVPKPGADNGNR